MKVNQDEFKIFIKIKDQRIEFPNIGKGFVFLLKDSPFIRTGLDWHMANNATATTNLAAMFVLLFIVWEETADWIK